MKLWLRAATYKFNADLFIPPPAQHARIGDPIVWNVQLEAIWNLSIRRYLQLGPTLALIAQNAADLRAAVPWIMAPPLRTRLLLSRRTVIETLHPELKIHINR
jgi:hypothetical protein